MHYLELLKALPREWVVLILSSLPIIEVRGAIPAGLYLGIAPFKLYFLALLGGVLPVFPIMFFLNFFTEKLRKIDFFDNFFEKLFEHTRKKGKIVEDLEALGLLIIIAIPLPGTGVWTGCLLAYLFGIKYLKTFFVSVAGNAIASAIVILVSMGVLKIFLP